MIYSAGAIVLLIQQMQRSHERMRAMREEYDSFYLPLPPERSKPFDWNWNMPIIVGVACIAAFIGLVIWFATQ